MSKTLQRIYRRAFFFALIFQFCSFADAQTLDVKIKIAEQNAFVTGSFKDAARAKNVTNFYFLKSYTNVENLGARVREVNLFDQSGQKIGYKKLADGEFLADGAFRSWSYRTDLTAPPNVSARAHVSWLAGEQGILMLGDLLPEQAEKTAARVAFELPQGWRISSVERQAGENVFDVADVEKAVFYVGGNLREREAAPQINLIFAGEWQVTDDEAAQMAREIFIYYEKMFGASAFEKANIFLGKFPADVKRGRWEAETRGRSVTLLSSEMDFKTQSLQRLHEQLRHEIFHLWLPNGVNLAGNYDWFYEGFALYQSLKTALDAKRIRFEDFLDTLGRAHSIDSLQSQRTSLIEASKNRWNGANTQIYARGMLVAFLVDIALLQKSKGKSSLPDLLREIYQKHNPAAPQTDGNAAILGILQSRGELMPIIERYIKGAETIAWQTDLESIGIESATANYTTKLSVKAKPTGRQKDLLTKLGYNNWRKNPE